LGVEDHVVVDGVGQVSFERADGFHGGLALADAAVDVCAADGVVV